jgi:hypothetical protein
MGDTRMKKSLVRIAFATMFLISAVDANASRSTIKTRLGWNSEETVKILRPYSTVETDAEKAEAIVAQLKNIFGGLGRSNPALKQYADTATEGLKTIEIALESVKHKRKIDDIYPDCTDAIEAFGSIWEAVSALNNSGLDINGIVSLVGTWPLAPAALVGTQLVSITDFYTTIHTAVNNYYNQILLQQQQALLQQQQAQAQQNAQQIVAPATVQQQPEQPITAAQKLEALQTAQQAAPLTAAQKMQLLRTGHL